MRRILFNRFLLGTVLTLVGTQLLAADIPSLLQTINQVGPKGKGHQTAQTAWQELSKEPADKLPQILAGLDEAGPLSSNWIRAAVDTIASRALESGKKLPVDRLEAFVLETERSPKGRRLAYDWLVRVDASASDRLIPAMVDDPCLEFRRDAIVRLVDQAKSVEASDAAQAKQIYRQAMHASRDLDQIELLAKTLRGLGEDVDLPGHMGFLQAWHVVGAFDNAAEGGLDTVFPPEEQVDLEASYAGKDGQKIRWLEVTTGEDMGDVDLNKALGNIKAAVAFAYCEFESAADQQVELRLGCVTANKIWVNGELIARNSIYHSGTKPDQYTAVAKLKKGKNQILIKVCQNEQTEPWAQDWKFQLRVCDHIGTAVLAANRPKVAPEVKPETPAPAP